jgi:hypothetical protein
MTDRTDIFLDATKLGLRFDSVVGLLTTEDLWRLPLSTSRPNQASLEAVGNALLKKQAALEGGSILGIENTSREKRTVDLMVAIIRKVVEVRQAENDARLAAANKAAKRQELLDAIQKRELSELPIDELKKRLEDL